MKRYDIDAATGGFEPVAILIRGREYVLGTSAAQLLRVQDVKATVVAERSGATEVALASALIGPVLRALVPDLVPALDAQPLTAAEELALFRPIAEVLGQLSRFRAPTG